MLLSAIGKSTYRYLSPITRRNFSSIPIAFKSSKDTFSSNVYVTEEEFNDNISKKERVKLKKGILDILKDKNATLIGYGADGSVYKLYDEDTDRSYAVKIPHSEDKNPITGEKQRTHHNFNKEKNILKLIDNLDSNFQKFIGYFKLNDGRTILVTSYINGDTPDVSGKRLNEKSLSSILEMLYELDCNGLLHRDLKKENIKINQDEEAGIFDFGEGICFDLFDKKTNTEEISFPPFEAPTNLRNFEDTLLTPYINDLSKINSQEAKEFFKKYLQLKSGFHNKKAIYLKNILQNTNPDKESKEYLEKMIAYEETLSNVFKNPDDNIIATELHKNNITYNSELAYKNEILLLNPLANISLKANAIIEAKKLENHADKQIQRPNTIEKKNYYNYRREEAKFRQQKISSWMKGLTNWFLECLTTDIHTSNEYKKALIDQCIDDRDLTDFEIPNIKLED